MYTVKFISFFGEESSHKQTETVIECPHYQIDRFDWGAAVTTYTDTTTKDGVVRHVTKDENRSGRYDCLYITNSSGKTIEAIHA